MRRLLLCALLVLAAPVGYADAAKEKAAEEKQTNAELQRSLAELKDSLERLAARMTSDASKDGEKTSAWLKEKIAQVDKLLQTAGEDAKKDADQATADAAGQLATAFEGLAKAIDGLAKKAEAEKK